MNKNFLSKKSWHTGSFKHIEKVWKAEQVHAQEEKRLQELRKQLERERELQDLSQIKDDYSTGPKKTQRLDWMYEQPMQKADSEEYMMGKPIEEEKTKEDLKTPGLFQNRAPPSAASEAWNKLQEDPLLAIKKKEKQAREQVKQNPMQMKLIKDKLLQMEKLKKEKKKKDKKERKELKRKLKEEANGHLQQSPKKEKQASPRREAIKEEKSDRVHTSPKKESSPKRRSRSRSRSRDRDRRDRHDRDRQERRRSRSRSRSRDRDSRRDRERHDRHRRSRSRSRSRDRDNRRDRHRSDRHRHDDKHDNNSNSGTSSSNGTTDTSSNGRPRLNPVKTEPKQSTGYRRKGPFIPSKHFNEQSMEEKYQQMVSAAQQAEDLRKQKLAELEAKDAEDEKGSASSGAVSLVKGEKPKFLDMVHRQSYTGSEETVEDRLRRNKHFIDRKAGDEKGIF